MTDEQEESGVDDPESDGADGRRNDGSDDEDGHGALPVEDLQYPEFVFDDGDIAADGAFDLSRELDHGEMADWLSELASGMASHDVAVESPEGYVTFGVGASGVEMSFDPDEDGVGNLEVTFSLRAKPMFVADDPDRPKAGARGGRGFVPVEMLTTDRERFRCYNWMADPTEGNNSTDSEADGSSRDSDDA